MISMHVLLDDGTSVVFDNCGRTVNLCLEQAVKIGTSGVVARDAKPPVYYPPRRIKEIVFEGAEETSVHIGGPVRPR